MDIWPVSFQEFKTFFLVLVRISTVLFMFPFFSTRGIPFFSKVGLSLMITILLFPVLDGKIVGFPGSTVEMILMMGSELLLGMILGMMVNVFFEGVRIMGQMAGFQTGFSITNIIDPHSGVPVAILSNMAFFVAMVFFLLLNGHHVLLRSLKESFEIIQVGSLGLSGDLFQKLIQAYGAMFIIAVKIGAPVMAALTFTQVAFGLVSKLIPQMNIMVVAFPVQIIVGLLFFGVTLHLLLGFVENTIGSLDQMLMGAMRGLRI